jgi:DNA-directed RNA polymerase subunit RPC12/RpoP
MTHGSTCLECHTILFQPVERHDTGDQYRCPKCGSGHVRKEGDPDYYAIDHNNPPVFSRGLPRWMIVVLCVIALLTIAVGLSVLRSMFLGPLG